MKLLLDTHPLIWWFEDSDRLSDEVRRALVSADQVLVSAASVYEIAFKHRLGKLPGVASLLRDVAGHLAQQDFVSLPVSLPHAEIAATLSLSHRDPFDWLLIAQAQIEQAWLVSNETLFDNFGVRRFW